MANERRGCFRVLISVLENSTLAKLFFSLKE